MAVQNGKKKSAALRKLVMAPIEAPKRPVAAMKPPIMATEVDMKLLLLEKEFVLADDTRIARGRILSKEPRKPLSNLFHT